MTDQTSIHASEIILYFPFFHRHGFEQPVERSALAPLPPRLAHDKVKVDFRELLLSLTPDNVRVSGAAVPLPARFEHGDGAIFFITAVEINFYTCGVGELALTIVGGGRSATAPADASPAAKRGSSALETSESAAETTAAAADERSKSRKSKKMTVSSLAGTPMLHSDMPINHFLRCQLALVENQPELKFLNRESTPVASGALCSGTLSAAIAAELRARPTRLRPLPLKLSSPTLKAAAAAVGISDDGDERSVREPAHNAAHFWAPDERFSKLFVFVRVQTPAESGDDLLRAAYPIGMVSTEARAVDDGVFQTFVEKNCYTRWLPKCVYVVHTYGGALVERAPGAPAAAAPLSGATVPPKTKFAGHAFMIEQLVAPLLYHRTFLSRLRSDLLLLSDGTEAKQAMRARTVAAKQLQTLYGEFLRFRARHYTGTISDSNANRALWAVWREQLEMSDIADACHSSVTDLQVYYASIAAEKQQQAVNILSVVLGALGLAALAIDIYTGDRENMIGSTTIVLLFLIASCIYLAIMSRVS